MAIKTRIAKLEKIVKSLHPEPAEDFQIWGVRADGSRFQIVMTKENTEEGLRAAMEVETFTDGDGNPLSDEDRWCWEGLRGALREMVRDGQLQL